MLSSGATRMDTNTVYYSVTVTYDTSLIAVLTKPVHKVTVDGIIRTPGHTQTLTAGLHQMRLCSGAAALHQFSVRQLTLDVFTRPARARGN